MLAVGQTEFSCSISIEMVSELTVVGSFFSSVEAAVIRGVEFLRELLREPVEAVLDEVSAKDGKSTGDNGEEGSGGSGVGWEGVHQGHTPGNSCRKRRQGLSKQIASGAVSEKFFDIFLLVRGQETKMRLFSYKNKNELLVVKET